VEGLASADMDVSVREYVPADYHVCRGLWAELTEVHRQLYGDRSIGGDDHGSGFDEYLQTPRRVNSWVAVINGDVVGLTGLLDHGTSGQVEPVIVTNARRRQGVGQTLIERVAAEASRRGYEYLAIRPVARNVPAIQSFYDAGFRTLGAHIDLTMDLKGRRHRWMEGVKLHELDFRY
jgi:GNAT superfamily N-acetyltransferase